MAEKKKVRKAPATARANIAAARKGGSLMGNAVARLKNRFGTAASADAFANWRMMPETQLFIDALRECAMNPINVAMDTDSVEVQFGVTSGFQVAASILDDPSSIFHDLFGATPGSEDELTSSYSVSPEGDAGVDR